MKLNYLKKMPLVLCPTNILNKHSCSDEPSSLKQTFTGVSPTLKMYGLQSIWTRKDNMCSKTGLVVSILTSLISFNSSNLTTLLSSDLNQLILCNSKFTLICYFWLALL